MSCDHDRIAGRLAKSFKTKHRDRGVDIVSRGVAIEVAVTRDDLFRSVRQLRRSRAKKKYVAVPSALIPKAKEILEGTGIGIMNTRAKIRKRSRRKKS